MFRVKYRVASVFLISVFIGSQITMAHGIPGLPPFRLGDERPSIDRNFRDRCISTIKAMMKNRNDIVVGNVILSHNLDFGLVCRADFTTPHDDVGTVNRIILWQLSDGEVAEFVGFDIPATPLKT